MSLPVIPASAPRSDFDPLLRKSLRLWDSGSVMMWVIAVIFACMAVGSIGDLSIGDSVMNIAFAAFGVYAAMRARRASGRLRRVWREGQLVEVTVKDWYVNAGRWRATIVEYEGRRGEVCFTRAPDVGMKLPALVLGELLAVVQPRSVLRVGKISPPQS